MLFIYSVPSDISPPSTITGDGAAAGGRRLSRGAGAMVGSGGRRLGGPHQYPEHLGKQRHPTGGQPDRRPRGQYIIRRVNKAINYNCTRKIQNLDI